MNRHLRQIEQKLDQIQDTYVDSSIKMIERVITGTILANISAIKSDKIPTFLFSTALQSTLYPLWNSSFSEGMIDVGKELRTNFNTNDDNLAEFADEASELLKAAKQTQSQAEISGDLQNAQALIALSEGRKAQVEARLQRLGYADLNNARSILYQADKGRIEPPQNIDQLASLVTEARGYDLDIKDASVVATKLQKKIAKLEKIARPSKKTVSATNSSNAPEETPSSMNAPQQRQMKTRTQASVVQGQIGRQQPSESFSTAEVDSEIASTKQQLANTNSSSPLFQKLQRKLISLGRSRGQQIVRNKQQSSSPQVADQIKANRLRQELASAKISDEGVQLYGTEYDKYYLAERTQTISKLRGEALNNHYKQKIAEYLNKTQGKGGTSTINEQKLIRDLTGQTDSRQKVSRINSLLEGANVPSKTGGATTRTEENISNERDAIKRESIFPFVGQVTYEDEDGKVVRDYSPESLPQNTQLENSIAALKRKRKRQPLTDSEQTSLASLQKRLDANNIELANAKSRLKELTKELKAIRSGQDLRNLNQRILISDEDKQLLNLSSNNPSVFELDNLRKQYQRSGQSVDPQVLNALNRIAQTEVTLAYNVGRIAKLKQHEQQTGKKICVEWRNDLENNVPCQFCASRNGTVISINEVLTQGGIKDAREYFIPAHPHCVVADTFVTLSDGISTKKISDIVIGDLVYTATDEKYQRVYAIQKTKINKIILKITLEDGRTIEGTKDHKVWDGRIMRPLSTFREGERFTVLKKMDIRKSKIFRKSIFRFKNTFIRNRFNNWDNRLWQHNEQNLCLFESYKYNLFSFSKEIIADIRAWRENYRNVSNSKNALFSNRKRIECNQRYYSQSINANENTFEDRFRSSSLSMDKRFGSQKTGSKEHAKCSNAATTGYKFKLQVGKTQRFRQPIFSFKLGSKFCSISRSLRCGMDLRTSKISNRQQRNGLYSRFLPTKTETIYRSKGLVERGRDFEVCEIQRTIPRNQNFRFRWEEIQNNNQIFQGVDQLRIAKIEEYILDDYVYDISVERDEVFFANGILVKNCRCAFMPTNCNRRNKTVPYKSIVSFIGGATAASLAIVGAYQALSRLNLNVGKDVRSALTDRVKPITAAVENINNARQILAPLTNRLTEDETVNIQPLPLALRRSNSESGQAKIAEAKVIKDSFIDAADNILSTAPGLGKARSLKQELQQRIDTIAPTITDNYDAFRELNSLNSRIEQTYNEFESRASELLQQRREIDTNRNLSDADRSAAIRRVQAQIESLSPNMQTFLDEINNVAFKARMARTKAVADLSSVIPALDAAKFQVGSAGVLDDDFRDAYNSYRAVEAKNIDPLLEIPEVSELNRVGLELNQFVGLYDQTAPDALDNIYDLKDSLTDLNYQTQAAGDSDFIRRRYAELQAEAKKLNRVVNVNVVGKTKDYNLTLSRMEAQLRGLDILRKSSDITPSYDSFIKQANEISDFIEKQKSRFNTNPKALSDEVAIMIPYAIDSPTLRQRIISLQNDKIQPSKDYYDQLDALEEKLKNFSETLETKPKLKTTDRISQQLGLNMTKEEYRFYLSQQESLIKAEYDPQIKAITQITKRKRTPEQNQQLERLTEERDSRLKETRDFLKEETVRINRAEFKRKKDVIVEFRRNNNLMFLGS